jgi:hypothetical protein
MGIDDAAKILDEFLFLFVAFRDEEMTHRTLQFTLMAANVKMKMSEYDKLFSCQPAQPDLR